MNRRIYLHPGPVVSKTDGQTHYITGDQLQHLYNIPPGMPCIVLDTPEKENGYCPEPGDIHLYPKSSGRYYELFARLKEKEDSAENLPAGSGRPG